METAPGKCGLRIAECGVVRLLTSAATGRCSLYGGLLLLGLLELGWGVWDWRRVHHDNLAGGIVHSAIFLAFFWFSVLLLLERASRGLDYLQTRGHSTLFQTARLAAATLVSLGCALILFSLVMRYVLGCFLSLPLVQFASANVSHGLWVHMVKAERWMLAGLSTLTVVASVWIFRRVWQQGTQLNLLGVEQRRRPVLLAWLAISVAFTLSTLVLNQAGQQHFRARMMSQISFKLDPLVTFALSCHDFYRQTLYESALLEPARLVRRDTPLPAVGPLRQRPNILFIQVESFRSDVIGWRCQGREITPNINRLAQTGTWFKRGYSTATHTSLSIVTTPSSLFALRKDMLVSYSTNEPYPKTLIWDVLKPQGYDTGWISSAFESWCGIEHFLFTPGLDSLIDSSYRKRMELQRHPELAKAEHIPVSLIPDNVTVATAMEWMGARIAAKKPFFTTLSLSDSHFPYQSSHTNAHWFQPDGIPAICTFNNYPRALTERVRNTYLNALHADDLLIGEVVEFLQQAGAAENTILVLFGDHGQSFYENNVLSHANLPYEPTINVALLMWGAPYFSARVEDYPTSLLDVVPTVLARLGMPPNPNFQGLDVLSSNRPSLETRCIYVHGDGLVNTCGLQAAGRWKYFEDLGKGDRYLFDLAQDPKEAVNLVETKPELADLLGTQLQNWRVAQLAYYRSARYYTSFYPPPPAMLSTNHPPR